MYQSGFTEAIVDILNRKWLNIGNLRLIKSSEGWGSEGQGNAMEKKMSVQGPQ